jgi:hypothetical protein
MIKEYMQEKFENFKSADEGWMWAAEVPATITAGASLLLGAEVEIAAFAGMGARLIAAPLLYRLTDAAKAEKPDSRQLWDDPIVG